MSESGNVCQNDLKLEGSEGDMIDYRVTVDFSEAFYRPELVLMKAGEETAYTIRAHST
jgi:hypothetical protein